MKLVFDDRAAHQKLGLGRYVRCLLAALHETRGAHSVLEGRHARRGDVFHAPLIDGVQLRPGVPQVVTIHDLAPLKRHTEYLRTGVRFRLRYLAVERAERVIVPTRAVAEDVLRHLRVEEDRVRVIGAAAVTAMRPRDASEIAAVRERYDLPPEYLVWVGGMEQPEPRKRVVALSRAPRELPLVLVGPLREWAHELEGVTLTGYVPDDDLAAIYSGARALVFPSDDEGFGLPTVEALACGTPVVACDIPALHEVLADRATFVERGDLAGLLAAGAAARRPAPAPPAFSWDDAARATWRVYEELTA